MLKTLLIISGILIAFGMTFVLFCCLRVVSIADDSMEEYYKNKEKQDFYDKNSDTFR